MTPRLKELFATLIDVPPPARSHYLDQHCPDPALRDEVESLLAAGAHATTFLEGHVQSAAAATLAESPPPLALGPYRTSRLLGRGGMGAVYLAARADGQVEQQVAIKLVQRGFESSHFLNRFHQERQILARLEHANIARLIDAGATPEGLPWFAMEYVDGLPIDRYCKTTSAPRVS